MHNELVLVVVEMHTEFALILCNCALALSCIIAFVIILCCSIAFVIASCCVIVCVTALCCIIVIAIAFRLHVGNLGRPV